MCQCLVQITFTQLHSLVLYGYGTERLAGAQLDTLQFFPLLFTNTAFWIF